MSYRIPLTPPVALLRSNAINSRAIAYDLRDCDELHLSRRSSSHDSLRRSSIVSRDSWYSRVTSSYENCTTRSSLRGELQSPSRRSSLRRRNATIELLEPFDERDWYSTRLE